MGLREDVDRVEEFIYGDSGRRAVQESWERVVESIPIIPPAAPIDTRSEYRCECGETWKSGSGRDQYCVKCGEKMKCHEN